MKKKIRSVAELSRDIGCSHSMASLLLSGQRLPGPTFAMKIHSIYEIPAHKILAGMAKGPESFGRMLRSEIWS